MQSYPATDAQSRGMGESPPFVSGVKYANATWAYDQSTGAMVYFELGCSSNFEFNLLCRLLINCVYKH